MAPPRPDPKNTLLRKSASNTPSQGNEAQERGPNTAPLLGGLEAELQRDAGAARSADLQSAARGPVARAQEPDAHGPSQSDLEALLSMGTDEIAQAMASVAGVPRQRLRPGAKVSGRIVRITSKEAFIDLGGKAEGILDVHELQDASGAMIVGVGDTIEASVVELADGVPKLSRGGAAKASRLQVEQAYAAGLPVRGRVTERNTGGFIVELSGMRAFCPSSQIDLHAGEDLDVYVGNTYEFKIRSLSDREAVVSRKSILEEQRRVAAAALRAKLAVGQTYDGVVARVMPFGVFVDIGGLEGLASARELSYEKVEKIDEAFQAGQAVRARVISVEGERIGLSLREAPSAPVGGGKAQKGQLGTMADLFAQARRR